MSQKSYMPVIIISQRIDAIESRNETRDSIDQALSRWVIAANAIPLQLPNMLSADALNTLLKQLKPCGIILSGGNNIGEHDDREQTENLLLEWAKSHNIPLLGICRGMQKIGTWAGSSLSAVDGHIATRHKITGTLNALVNSYHNYVLQDLPIGFSALAYCQQGHLEAITFNGEWCCEGWMWHPERETAFDPLWLARLRTLMKLS